MAHSDIQAYSRSSFPSFPNGSLSLFIRGILTNALEAIDASSDTSLALTACSISLAIEQMDSPV
jgi:hypothetical protein